MKTPAASVHYTPPTTLANSWYNAGTNSYIDDGGFDNSWVNSTLATAGPFNLWQANGANNPCPNGFHVPTKTEFDDYLNAVGGWSGMQTDPQLRLPGAGNRQYAGGYTMNEGSHYYWASTTSSVNPTRPDGINNRRQSRSVSVRCIQD